jgi:phenylalanyl-tRNA synthetase beta chain
VEEVGRLYGFDKLRRELPRRSITPAAKNPVFEIKQRIREQLSRSGANEVLTYSFVHEDVLKKAGQNPDEAYRLGNALSPDLQYYRLSLTPSLLEKVHPNIKAGHDEFALFEIGKAHIVGQLDDEGLPQEFQRLAFVYASKAQGEGAAFYKAKTYLTDLLISLGVMKEDIRYTSLNADEDTSFEPKRGANVLVGGEGLGRVGEYKSGVARGFKLPTYSAGFEISITMLAAAKKKRIYKPLPRFPKVTQDISLKVPNETPYVAVFDSAARTVAEHKPGECDVTLEPLSIYQPEGGADRKTITLRLSIASYEKTLTDKDVNQIMDNIANNATKELGAERI